MSNSNETPKIPANKSLTENFAEGVELSDEEIRIEQTKPDPLNNTSRETAYIDDDGTLVVHYWSMKDFVTADGWENLKPSDSEYVAISKRHGLEKVGDTNQILKIWRDGDWQPV